VRVSRRILVLGLSLFVAGIASAADRRHHGTAPAPGTSQKPRIVRAGPAAFGGTETVSSISALGFSPFGSNEPYSYDTNTYFRYFTAVPADFGGTISLPAGAVIDSIGLGTCDAAGGNWEVTPFVVAADGTFVQIDDFVSSAHGMTTPCAMDYSPAPLSFQIASNAAQSIQIDVYEAQTAPVDGSVQFGSVEVWWHTVVSPAPPTQTFTDVPPADFGFQYIEALAASGITGGCGGGNYCPDNPVNRRQMAIFLAKALGLYWPN
jgi:S-layer family protein